MTKACCLAAVGALLVGVSAGQAADNDPATVMGSRTLPAAEEGNAPQAANPVPGTEIDPSVVRQPTGGMTPAPPTPIGAAPLAAGRVEAANTCPSCGKAKHSHLRHLWQWLTYRPLQRPGLCGCCHQCVPDCYPPLYAFFQCYGVNACDFAQARAGSCAGSPQRR